MNKRFGAIAILVAAGAATAGLFASTSSSAPSLSPTSPSSGVCYKGPPCFVSLTAAGPSPSRMTMPVADDLIFENTDSVAHTVVFANGLCTLTLPPSTQEWFLCNPHFPTYVGSYAYTVDGKFPGTAVVRPLRRSVSLTARRHGIRRGTRLTLHGRVSWYDDNPLLPTKWPFHVIVLARHDGKHHFEPLATIPVGSSQGSVWGPISYEWKRNVQPGATTTYIAKVTGGTPPHWQGQFWINAKSRPFTVRTRH